MITFIANACTALLIENLEVSDKRFVSRVILIQNIRIQVNTYIAIWTSNLYDSDGTVNSEIFERILFSRIALKDIFATVKNHD